MKLCTAYWQNCNFNLNLDVTKISPNITPFIAGNLKFKI